MRFFIDNCLSPRVADALPALEQGFEVVALNRRFPPETPDIHWMNQLADEGDWVIVSRDELYKDADEKAALRSAGQILSFLSRAWRHLTHWELASKLFHWWPRIVEEASRARSGDCFVVPPKGEKLKKFRLM